MAADTSPADLDGVLDELAHACARAESNHAARSGNANGARVSVADVMETLGPRSFGPLILVPGLIGISPIGAIPGLPGVMALIVLIVTAQILVGMDHAWLPGALMRRAMPAARLMRAVSAIRPYARLVDRLLWPRLSFLTRGIFLYVIAALCLMVALVTPIIELVPMAGIVPNAAIVAFGLAVTAHDGVWALIAILVTGASFWMLAAAI